MSIFGKISRIDFRDMQKNFYNGEAGEKSTCGRL